jgi:hypothetical protein
MNEKLQASLDDPQFAALLEESQGFFDDAKDFYHWDPDDGENTCVLTKVTHTKEMSKKLEKEVVVVHAMVEILDGDDGPKDGKPGKSFDLAGSWGWSAANFTGLKTLASLLADEPIEQFVEALDLLYSNIGTGLLVKTNRTPNKTGGKYVNHRVQYMIEMTTDPADGGGPEVSE